MTIWSAGYLRALIPMSELEAAINARLRAAERLLASATTISDTAEHRLWQGSRELWVTATTGALAGRVDENVLRTLERATGMTTSEGSLEEDLPRELEAVRRGMAVLIGIRASLDTDRREPLEAAERRGPRLGP